MREPTPSVRSCIGATGARSLGVLEDVLERVGGEDFSRREGFSWLLGGLFEWLSTETESD